MKAIQQNGTLLRFASEELQNDRELAIIAINQNELSYLYVSKQLQDDIILELLGAKKIFQILKERIHNLSDIVFFFK